MISPHEALTSSGPKPRCPHALMTPPLPPCTLVLHKCPRRSLSQLTEVEFYHVGGMEILVSRPVKTVMCPMHLDMWPEVCSY